jgi:hypothetical protein
MRRIKLLSQMLYLYVEQKSGMQSTICLLKWHLECDLYQHLKSIYEVCHCLHLLVSVCICL